MHSVVLANSCGFYCSSKGPSTKDVRRFSLIFDHYPPHVCSHLHFKYPSLKMMSANRDFDPPPLYFHVLFFIRKKFFFAYFLRKSIKGSWISRMEQKAKITHPKDFSHLCSVYLFLRSTNCKKFLMGNVFWLYS